jgi:hypothetical protein
VSINSTGFRKNRLENDFSVPLNYAGHGSEWSRA